MEDLVYKLFNTLGFLASILLVIAIYGAIVNNPKNPKR